MSISFKSKLIIILLIVLILILVTVAFIFAMNLSHGNPGEEEVKLGPIYETQEFTVNVAKTLNHFIKAKFSIELSNEKVWEELQTKLPILEDTIIMVLSGQSLEALSNVEGKEELKET
ncbi:MAG: flagellar basal body-associated FliL family protein, partial [Clostridia bacterium]|nr:flagellar basal body-associated FliL family protein [Clostridia bacterium]